MARPSAEKSELLTIPVRGMFNGVSQQAPHARAEGYASEQENTYSTVMSGIKKRPPMEFVSRLYNSSSAAKIDTHYVDRGDADEHVILIHNGVCYVKRLSDGVDLPVTDVNSAGSYLTVTEDNVKFDFVTLHDVTLISNPQATPSSNTNAGHESLRGTTDGDNYYEGILFLKGSDSLGNYVYTVGGNVDLIRADSGDMDADATAIALHINVNLVGFLASAEGPVIHVKSTTIDTDFDLAATHSNHPSYIAAIKDKVAALSDLPEVGFHGYKVRVAGSASTTLDDYYVRFDVIGDTSPALGDRGKGIWVECGKPHDTYKWLDGMPIALVRTAAGFDLVNLCDDATTHHPQFRWANRLVGDDDTNPFPTIVGNKIKSMSLFKSRLSLVTEEGITFSTAGDVFNLFKKTVTANLADDGFNLVVSHPAASNFRHGISFDDDFLVFGDGCQFKVNGSPVFSSSTAQAQLVNTFEISDKAGPILGENNIYFGINRGTYSGMYMLSQSKAVENKLDGEETTAHIPRYIKGDFIKLVSQPKENLIVGYTDTDPSVLYIFKYYYLKGEQVQNSWSKFTLKDAEIKDIAFVDNELFITEKKVNDKVYMHKMRFLMRDMEDDGDYITHLDRRIDAHTECNQEGFDPAVVYDSATDETTFLLPYKISTGAVMEAYLRSTGSQIGGTKLDVTSQVAGQRTLKIKGDQLTDTPSIFIGEQYTMLYGFSPPLLRQSDGRPIITGRTQIRRGVIDFQDTGHMTIEVTPEYRDKYTYVYTGRKVDATFSLVDRVGISSGAFKFPVRTSNNGLKINLLNDSALPSKIIAAEFEMSYENRARTS